MMRTPNNLAITRVIRPSKAALINAWSAILHHKEGIVFGAARPDNKRSLFEGEIQTLVLLVVMDGSDP
jgi:hypothetical protein